MWAWLRNCRDLVFKHIGKAVLISDVRPYVIANKNNAWRVKMCLGTVAVRLYSQLGNFRFVYMIYMLTFMCVLCVLDVPQ
jgi:hypothetical protein